MPVYNTIDGFSTDPFWRPAEEAIEVTDAATGEFIDDLLAVDTERGEITLRGPIAHTPKGVSLALLKTYIIAQGPGDKRPAP